ncbi:MAG: metal-sulfur cluster biosynthetic enzyme [Bacteroidota bacterium]
MITKEELINELAKVKHPAIDYSLIDLCIVKNVELDNEIAKVNFAFPFPNIPIAGQLLHSVAQPINQLGLEFQYEIEVMTEEERAKFMQMESEAWIG